jgi:predicted RNA-binding Zn-ribbon protein involved in translation (DUF1610 family)
MAHRKLCAWELERKRIREEKLAKQLPKEPRIKTPENIRRKYLSRHTLFKCPGDGCGQNMRANMIRLRECFYSCRLCGTEFMVRESDQIDDADIDNIYE